MSDYSGTIKHALHDTCKSQIHTSCVASAEGIRRGKAGEPDGCPTCALAYVGRKRCAQPPQSLCPIDHRTVSIRQLDFSIGQSGHHRKPLQTLRRWEWFERRNSGRAISWAPASEELNSEQQHQLKRNCPADINANINGRTRPASQKALMVFIKAGDHQGTKDRQNGGAPPQSPLFDGHAVECLPPAVEKSEAD